jgi:nitroreductase
MDISKAIKGRRSIRVFKRKDLPEKTIEKLIDAARYAPTAGNVQPWEFVIVETQRIKNKLAAAALDQRSIEEAPIVIIACADKKRASMSYGLRGKTLYCIQDTAAAIQNILLTAYSLGLGTCWIGAFNEDGVTKALSIPKGIKPVAIIPVGYPDENPPQSRRPLNQIIHYEEF